MSEYINVRLKMGPLDLPEDATGKQVLLCNGLSSTDPDHYLELTPPVSALVTTFSNGTSEVNCPYLTDRYGECMNRWKLDERGCIYLQREVTNKTEAPIEYSPTLTYGQALKDTLEKRGITQAFLAQQMGINSSYLNRVVQGKVTPLSRSRSFEIGAVLHLDENETQRLVQLSRRPKHSTLPL